MTTLTLPPEPPLDPRLVALAKILGRAIAFRRLRNLRTSQRPSDAPVDGSDQQSDPEHR